MRRLIPSPWMSAGLLVLWLLMSDTHGPGTWLMGAVAAIGAPLLTAGLRPGPRMRVRRFDLAIVLLGRIAFDMLRSNAAVLLAVLRSPRRAPASAFVRVPVMLREPHALAVFAMILTVIPGTVWCELSPDGAELLVHVFDMHDEQGLVDEIQQRYQQPLKEIFE
jgi:multicomponent K+:H+ antiporter subunit E